MNHALQSIIFDKKSWTPKRALNWVISHNYRPKKMVDVTDRKIRFRLREPKQFRRFITKDIGNGIKFIIGFY